MLVFCRCSFQAKHLRNPRYEVQDPEPDELGNHGQIYKALAHQLIPIPSDSSGLPTYPNGKQVLARYPETTTFYKAEVIGTKVCHPMLFQERDLYANMPCFRPISEMVPVA
ncbi:hypothetical protein ABW21_db0206315 [Orbilia brochopaga]|nr:hypothetical protein ABW21_db0206315 [Drechslerella brochopaga]